MAAGSFGHYSKKAQGAINRFYEHADTRTINALQELVSDLALADGADLTKKWKKAEELLSKAGASAGDIAKSAGAKDLRAFAELVGKIVSKK